MFARRFWRRTVAAAAALIAVASLGGCGKGAPPPPAAKPVQKAEIAGVNLYRQALATQDGDESLGLLEQAVRTNPRLTEAWYELGRFKVKRATILIKTDELQAVQMFREGLGAEQEALRLLDDGKVTVWSAAEQEEARAALQTDLRDAEEAMTGPEALLSALRQRTY